MHSDYRTASVRELTGQTLSQMKRLNEFPKSTTSSHIKHVILEVGEVCLVVLQPWIMQIQQMYLLTDT